MARSRDISKVLSSNTTLATDAEVAASYLTQASASTNYASIAAGSLTQLVPQSITAVGGTGSVSANGAVTFTTCSSISLNNVFSSTYQNYRVVLRTIGNTTFLQVKMRLRNNTTDIDSANYQGRLIVWGNDGGSASESFVNSTSLGVVWNQGTKNSLSVLDIGDPFLTENTTMIGTVMCGYVASNDSNQITSLTGGFLQTSTSYNGLTFFAPAQNLSGNIRIYGYRN